MMEVPKAMKEQYVTRREKDLLECFDAIEKHDTAVPLRVGHQMKGNASMFGYAPLAEIGANMESSAKDNDWTGIAKYTEEFKEYLKSIPRA